MLIQLCCQLSFTAHGLIVISIHSSKNQQCDLLILQTACIWTAAISPASLLQSSFGWILAQRSSPITFSNCPLDLSVPLHFTHYYKQIQRQRQYLAGCSIQFLSDSLLFARIKCIKHLRQVTVNHVLWHTRAIHNITSLSSIHHIRVIYCDLSTRLLNHCYTRCTELETENS